MKGIYVVFIYYENIQRNFFDSWCFDFKSALPNMLKVLKEDKESLLNLNKSRNWDIWSDWYLKC